MPVGKTDYLAKLAEDPGLLSRTYSAFKKMLGIQGSQAPVKQPKPISPTAATTAPEGDIQKVRNIKTNFQRIGKSIPTPQTPDELRKQQAWEQLTSRHK